MTVWSATPYNGEADVLEIRLGTLEGVVDRHILVEGDRTQRGEPKALTYPQQRERFERWPITYQAFTLEDGEGEFAHWARERALRDGIAELLTDVADDDLVLLSDVDEIPFPEAVRDYGEPHRLEMDMHLYGLNWRWQERPVRDGTRAVILSGERYKRLPIPSRIVEADWALSGSAGWHLAYQGNVAAIQRSILSKADEIQRFEWLNPEHLAYCRQTGADLFMRSNRQCEWCPDSEVPPYALEHRERFEHLFLQKPMEDAA